MKHIVTRLFAIGLLTVSVAACQTSGLGSTFGATGPVKTLDASERARLQTGLTQADYRAFSEKVTMKMLSSDMAVSWVDKKPKLILGDVVNNTDNENIRVADIYDRIQGTILNSGLVRIVDRSANSFDYVVKPELTSTRQYDNKGSELAFFTLKLKLFKLDGELVGQWSDDLALGQIKS